MLESSEIEIPADGINLETGVMGARATSVQGILIRDAQFIGSGVKN
jgi:C4-type Zn-finger protein